MAETFKALAALLSFPTIELKHGATALWVTIKEEGLLPDNVWRDLNPLIRELACEDLKCLQSRYLQLFGHARGMKLNVFAHIDNLDHRRDNALVGLERLYARHRYVLAERDRPDYLPILLTFLSRLTEPHARHILKVVAPILEAMLSDSGVRGSSYSDVLGALVHLATNKKGYSADADFNDEGAIIGTRVITANFRPRERWLPTIELPGLSALRRVG